MTVALVMVDEVVMVVKGSGAPKVCADATGPSAPRPSALIPVTLK